MDGFEFVFSLFGLLLGFSLVEVLAGLARIVEAGVRNRRPETEPGPRIGWLTPLLGLFVILNLVSFWTAAWSLRESIPVNYPALMFGMVVTGGYYFAASLVFPRELGTWPDLDDHYLRVKSWVAAVITACNALGTAGTMLIARDPINVAGGLLPNLLFYGALVALIFARGRRVNLALLVFIIAQYPIANLIIAIT